MSSRANRGCCSKQGSSGVLGTCCGLGPLTSEQTFEKQGTHNSWESEHCFLRDPELDPPTLLRSGPLEENLGIFILLAPGLSYPGVSGKFCTVCDVVSLKHWNS